MEKTMQKEYRTKLNEMLEIWNTIAEEDKPYVFAELYESMTDTQKDRFLVETENS